MCHNEYQMWSGWAQGDLYEVRLQSTLGDFATLVARKMGAGWHPENMRFWLWDRAPGGHAHVCLPCYVPGGEHAKTPISAPALTYAGLQQDRLDKGLAAPVPGRRSQEARGSALVLAAIEGPVDHLYICWPIVDHSSKALPWHGKCQQRNARTQMTVHW